MRRRLDLAAGLVGEPRVVFLDEPTTGLDPRSRQELWQVSRASSRGGTTVFLTTQYLEEADQLADRIALVDGGRLVAEGTAGELKSRVAGHRLDLVWPTATRICASRPAPCTARPKASPSDCRPTAAPTQVRALLDEIDPDGTDVIRFAVHSATLDDVFLALTGAPTTPTTSAAPTPVGEPVATDDKDPAHA